MLSLGELHIDGPGNYKVAVDLLLTDELCHGSGVGGFKVCNLSSSLQAVLLGEFGDEGVRVRLQVPT